MLRVQAMDRALGNRPMTVGWGYFLSSLSLRALAQPSFIHVVKVVFPWGAKNTRAQVLLGH